MSYPPLPAGYDETKRVHGGRTDCHVTVGFDRWPGRIPRFLVQLHYQISTEPVHWEAIARMDHNETSVTGHDVYHEGLHIDVTRRGKSTVHLEVPHGTLPKTRGTVIRGCVNYLKREADYMIGVYEGDQTPGSPPEWAPDGGDPTHTFISPNALEGSMSQEAPADDDEILTDRELTELLAEAEGVTPEEIEKGAEELEIAPPWEATVVEE